MKQETPSPQPEATHKSHVDEAIVKDGTVVGLILTAVPVIFLVFIVLGAQNGDLRFTEMVLYNNTGGEITTYGAGGLIGIQKNSWGRIPHPLSPGSLRKGYKGFTVSTVNRRWSYFVVDPHLIIDYRGTPAMNIGIKSKQMAESIFSPLNLPLLFKICRHSHPDFRGCLSLIDDKRLKDKRTS